MYFFYLKNQNRKSKSKKKNSVAKWVTILINKIPDWGNNKMLSLAAINNRFTGLHVQCWHDFHYRQTVLVCFYGFIFFLINRLVKLLNFEKLSDEEMKFAK